jgi:hypothetical protein
MPTPQNTLERTSTPEKQTSTWSDAENLVSGFQFEPDFMAQLMRADAAPGDPTTREFADTLSAYSESFIAARELDQTINPDVAQQITLIANAPLYITTQEDLEYYENERKHRRLPDDEWEYLQSLKAYVVWFNQQTSDYAYTHPDEHLTDVNKALIDSALNSHPKNAKMVEQHITNTTRGARTEAVTRQLLDIAGVPYQPGTAEQDRKGGDVIILYKGNEIKVDIKSSLSDIAYERGGYEEIQEKHLMYAINKRPKDKLSDHVVKLYPGFEDKDIGDSLGIKPGTEFAASRSQLIAIQLQKAIQELGL